MSVLAQESERQPYSMGSHAKRGAESTKSLQNKNTEINSVLWCSRRDLNPYGHPLEPKSSASANFATTA